MTEQRSLSQPTGKKINELDAELSKEDPDRTVVQVKLELISKTYEKVDSRDHTVLQIVNREGTDEEQEEEITVISDYEEHYTIFWISLIQ